MIPFSDEKLAQYFSNELSKEEGTAIEEWTKLSDNNGNELTLLKSAWNSLKSDSLNIRHTPKPNWAEFENTYLVEKQKSYKHYFLAVATVLIAVLSFVFNDAPEQLLYETGLGESKLVSLPDGSNVRLNYNSKLKFEEFGDSRTVHLEGEGYFEIKRDESRPFIIETASSTTTVLGTKFNLKSRKTGTELIVTEGKVSFAPLFGDDTAKILIKDQKCDILLNGTISEIVAINSVQTVAWLKKRLIFKTEMLENVVSELENIYNKSIHLDSEVTSETLTAVLHYDKPLTELLKQISISLNLSFSEKNGEFYLRKSLKGND